MNDNVDIEGKIVKAIDYIKDGIENTYKEPSLLLALYYVVLWAFLATFLAIASWIVVPPIYLFAVAKELFKKKNK